MCYWRLKKNSERNPNLKGLQKALPTVRDRSFEAKNATPVKMFFYFD